MTEQDQIKLVRRGFELLNEHNPDPDQGRMIPECTVETPVGSMSPEGYRQYVQSLIVAFPDLRFELRQVIAQGPLVAALWTASGTHNGPLASRTGEPVPATGRQLSLPGCTVFQFDEMGQITQQELIWDRARVLEQLGLMQTQSTGTIRSA